ncbi:MAG TPA: type 2 isopentenyl-diphosphate Delta-isomerase [Anaerolineales bacterium]|nr:type 2 isopentenyl-diphosphate Delta-isomerase [Anaerolineales bacterium]HRQ91324.1 type 2 isopentenyl-diphosphate Delta-isomerase [Anaerolineales bacterium]
MAKVTGTGARKADHIRINLEEDVRSGLTTGFEKYSFLHNALPELNLNEISLGVQVFGKQLKAPLLISSMTGGTDEAGAINQALAEAAQETGIALGLGSQRAAIEDPKLEPTFRVRNVAPDILLFANVGAVQLNYGYGLNHLQRAVDMAEADALMLHLNAVQEAVQPEGDTNFSGLLKKIEIMCKQMPVPVVIKEVGWGISGELAKQLARAGVQAIDVAGAGGTSWSQVEMHRAKNPSQARLAAAFVDWGIPTAESIMQVRQAVKAMRIFASGGLRSGVDVAKGIALGAELGGMAGPFLKAAVKSSEAVVETINEVSRELQVAMFAAGAGDIASLQAVPLIYRGE